MKTEIIQPNEINYGFYAIKNCLCKSNAGVEYELIYDEILGVGGESYVYKCRRIDNEKTFAIKYFINDRISSFKTKENEEKYIFLNEISKKCNIVRILDWGTIEITYNVNSDVKIDTFYFEIMPIYDSDLESKRLSYNDIKNELLPNILEVLNELHKNNYVHRDINPKNIFKKNNEYFLSDVGIMRKVEAENDGYGQTTTIAGTPGFVAPEVNNFCFSNKSDYYSLGCVLAYSYLGHHPYQEEINKRRSIYLMIKQYGMPINADKKEADLQDLINHLCDIEEDNRPGYDDVNTWIINSKQFVDKYKNIKSSFNYTYTFAGKEYKNSEELSIAMSDNWNEALNHFQGGINGSPLFMYLNYNQDIKAKAINIYSNSINSKSCLEDREIVLSKILFLMSNKKAFIFKDLRFKSISKLKNKSVSLMSQILKSGYLSWALNEIKELDKSKYESIKVIEELSQINEKIAVSIFNSIEFNDTNAIKEKAKKNNRTNTNYLKLCDQMLKGYYSNLDSKLLFEDNVDLWKKVFLSGNHEYVLEFQNNHRNDNDSKKLIYIFEMLERIDTQNIYDYRFLFYNYGPLSHIRWFKDNLNLYKFNSTKTIEFKNYINNKKIKIVDSILKQIEVLEDLKVPYQEIVDSINNDVLINKLDKSETTVLYSDGLLSSFKSSIVPCGYIKFIDSYLKPRASITEIIESLEDLTYEQN